MGEEEYKQRGVKNRQKRKGYGGLMKPIGGIGRPVPGNWNADILKEELYKFFYTPRPEPRENVKIQIAIHANSKRASWRKARKTIQTMINPLKEKYGE